MKKLFLSLVALMAATVSFAQGSLLATLSHEGNISAFYGADALKSAMEVAEAGDVITLSSGQFNAAKIDKAVTLRGAGMSNGTDSLHSHGTTVIQNNFTISLTDSLSGRLMMEGLYVNGSVYFAGHIKNSQFLKCRFFGIYYGNSETKITNASFIHSRISHSLDIPENSSASFVNCVVSCPHSPKNSSFLEFDNCFVKFDLNTKESHHADNVVNSLYNNCIIQQVGASGNSNISIPSSCTANNCVGLGVPTMFSKMPSNNKSNTYVNNITTIFKNYSITNYNTYVNDAYNFELTESAASTYLGLDGTQVGIYGGNLPYDENPIIPQITKCNVAAKSTADGKLSVDIEVKAASY